MYGITKTRMLLTTVVFAAVAALFAAGANARIPADTGSAFAAQESLGIGRFAVLPSVTKVAGLRDERERDVLRRGDLRGPRPRTTPRRTHQRGRDQGRNTGRNPGMLRRPCREVDRAGVGLLGGYSGHL